MAHRRFISFLHYSILIILVVAASYAIIHYSGRQTVSYERPSSPVVVAKPLLSNLSLGIRVWGHVEASNTVAVVPLVGGTIEEHQAEIGSKVEAGTIISRIDPTPFRQQMLQAQSAKIVAETTFERIERLHRTKSVSNQVFEEALAQRDATLAQWKSAQWQLDQTQVAAPITGTILQSLVSVGTVASPEKPVAILADLESLTVRIQPPAKYFSVLNDNRADLRATVITISREGGSVEIPAAIKSIAPYIDATSNTFELECEISSNNLALAPGMLVQIKVDYAILEDVHTLRQSDRTADGSFYIYNEENSTAFWTSIPPLGESDKLIAIPESFKDTWFIVDGHHSVLDGQVVTVVGERQE